MDLSSLKIAAYLDEPSYDVDESAAIIAEAGIKHVCLRNVWLRAVSSLNDDGCTTLKEILSQHGLTPILLHTEVGNVLVERMNDDAAIEEFERAAVICKFFGCKTMRFHVGQPTKNDQAMGMVTRWMKYIGDRTLALDIQPAFDTNYWSAVSEPAQIASILRDFKRWTLIYDPAVLLSTKNIDPFVKFWTLLKDRVSHLDIHDYKAGMGPRPAGHGDCRLDLTLSDAMTSNYSGWYCLETGLGKQHGKAQTKIDTFKLGLSALNNLLKRIA